MKAIDRLLPLDLLTVYQQIKFWCHVDRKGSDDCWLWSGSKCNGTRYGRFQIGNRTYIASRISWFLHHGKDPGKIFVLHSCNTPACVNPKHLFLGTTQENNQQAHDDGHKNQDGELHPSAKLTERDVLEIRASGLPVMELVRRYQVAYATIDKIQKRETWKHI